MRKQNKKIIIQLDLDGVCCDWLGGCCRVCGLDPNNKELREEMKSGKDMQDIVSNHLTEKEMWDRIAKVGSEWWRGLAPLPWADRLYFGLQDLCEVAFLSSPGNLEKFPESVPLACKGKMEWIYDWYRSASVILTQSKHFCATPNSILIDDSEKKISKFIEYGGKGFLWPNQYKLLDGDTSIEKTFDLLESIIRNMSL